VKTVVAYFKAIFQHFYAANEENHEEKSVSIDGLRNETQIWDLHLRVAFSAIV
jgi:hypothetical protein